MKYLKFVLFCFLLSLKIFSQDTICGATISENYLNTTQALNQKSLLLNPSTICVNIHFKIIRQNDGSGGFNVSDLPLVIQQLNLRYNKHGIFLKSIGYDEINNSTFFDIDDDNEANLLNINLLSDAINVYLVNTGPWGGAAKIISNKMIITNPEVFTSTAEHELGHCFGLLHTHDTRWGVENINGSNCLVAGDLICDTKADPNLSGRVNIYCQYDGSANNPANGIIYDPDENNIMSYSRKNCRVRFTDGQKDFMFNKIQTESVLIPTISTSCQLPSIDGASNICGSASKTYTFNYAINYTNEVDSWAWSSNLTMESQSLTSITVKAAPGASGAATITANINGYAVEKHITLDNVPSISNYQIQGVGNTVGVYSFDTVYINASSNTTQYQWTIVDDFNSCNGIYNGPVFTSNNSTQITTTSTSVGINWGFCTGTFRVRCKAINGCGFRYYSDKQVTVEDEPCPPSLLLSPNPSSDQITARIAAPAPCDDIILRSSIDNNVTYTIYDSSGTIKFQKKNAKHLEKINIKSFKDGIYFIEALLPDKRRYIKSLVKK